MVFPNPTVTLAEPTTGTTSLVYVLKSLDTGWGAGAFLGGEMEVNFLSLIIDLEAPVSTSILTGILSIVTSTIMGASELFVPTEKTS